MCLKPGKSGAFRSSPTSSTWTHHQAGRPVASSSRVNVIRAGAFKSATQQDGIEPGPTVGVVNRHPLYNLRGLIDTPDACNIWRLEEILICAHSDDETLGSSSHIPLGLAEVGRWWKWRYHDIWPDQLPGHGSKKSKRIVKTWSLP